jgi:hypothetical protein
MAPSTEQLKSFPNVPAVTLAGVRTYSCEFTPLREMLLWYVVTPARSVTPTVIEDKEEGLAALVAVMVNCPAVAGAV